LHVVAGFRLLIRLNNPADLTRNIKIARLIGEFSLRSAIVRHQLQFPDRPPSPLKKETRRGQKDTGVLTGIANRHQCGSGLKIPNSGAAMTSSANEFRALRESTTPAEKHCFAMFFSAPLLKTGGEVQCILIPYFKVGAFLPAPDACHLF